MKPRHHMSNDRGIKESEENPKNAEAMQNRLVTLLDKQGREIRDQYKIIKRIEEFITELYDTEQSTIIHTDPKVVPEITSTTYHNHVVSQLEENNIEYTIHLIRILGESLRLSANSSSSDLASRTGDRRCVHRN